MKKINLFSVVVTYNPVLIELENLINILRDCTDFIVICNNSVQNIVVDNFENVKIFNFQDNLGISKAQNIGMYWAFNNGAEFVLQLDQDSVISSDMIEKLSTAYFDLSYMGYKIGIIGPTTIDKGTKIVDKPLINWGKQIPNTEYYIVESTLSSGSIIPKVAFETVGGLEDGLFIDMVDFEYCWRMKKHDFLVVINRNAFLFHSVGNGIKKIGKTFRFRVPNPIRHYYQYRNFLLLLRRNYVPISYKLINIFKFSIKFFILPLILSNGKERKMYMIKGIKDGINNKYGRFD